MSNKKAMTFKVIAFLLGLSLSYEESLQALSYDEAAKRVLTTDHRPPTTDCSFAGGIVTNEAAAKRALITNH